MYDHLKKKIRTVPNWPKEGIMFRDISTLLRDPEGFKETIDILYDRYKRSKLKSIVGIESRGFIIGSVLAYRLGIGFVLIRKPGKLPGKVVSKEYELEYGRDKIEMQKDAIKKDDKVLLVDDLIATGGTALAACHLLKSVGAQLHECCFILDLPDVGGTKKVQAAGYKVFYLISFEGE